MFRYLGGIFGVLLFIMSAVSPAFAANAGQIERDAQAALDQLYETVPGAKDLGESAKGILVFPKILKAGLFVGGQGGNGAFWQDSEIEGYYNSAGVSYGLQAGAQTFGYALFFMTEADLQYLNNSKGWEVGVGPDIVVVDAGKAADFSSTTAKNGVYAFIFGQKGLMAGISIKGSKITEIHPN